MDLMRILAALGGPQGLASMQLGPSLLTQPKVGSAPPDAAALAAPMNAQPIGASPPMGQPTLEQMAAQQRPMQAPLAPQMPWLGKILNTMAPIPDAYKAMLSPQDQRRMQLQSIAQIGAGLTGAYTKPGESQSFGPNLSRGFGASREGMQTALQPAMQANTLQMEQMKTQDAGIAQQGLAEARAKFPPVPGEAPEQYIERIRQAGLIAATSGNAPEAAALAALARDMESHGSARDANAGIAPPDWYQKYSAANPPPATGGDLAMAKYQAKMAQAMMRDGFWKAATETRLQGQDSYKSGWNPVIEGGRNSRFDMGQTLSQARIYDRQIQPELVMVQNRANFDAHYDDAVAGNRQAYEPLIIAYASIADSKAQLRQGVIVMVQKYLDPSFKGTFQMAVSRLASGTLPPEVLAGMKQNIDGVMKERRANVERWYKGAVKDRPEIEGYIQSPDEIYGGQAAPATTPGANQYDQYYK